MSSRQNQVKLGDVFELSNRKLGNHDIEPAILAISKYDGVVLAETFFGKRIASRSLKGYKVLDPEEWVYSTIHIDEGSIAVNHLAVSGVVSPMYTTMRWAAEHHSSQYFELLLKSRTALNRYFENAQGTVNRRRSLSWKVFSALKFDVPPLAEQKRIVDLVSAVDEYIAALQRQADAARTARNAVLNELLTAGGDDWVETTIGDISDFVSTRHLPAGLGREIPYVGLEHIESRSPRIRDWGTIESVTSHVTPFEPEDVLFGRLRPYLHKVAFAEFPGVCSPEVLVLRATQKCSAKFLYLTCSVDSTVKACVEMSAGTRMPRTSTSDLASISLWLPPLHEQNQIVAVVSSTDDLIHATESAIGESKNLRSGLLSDLLSGEHEIPASYDRLLGAA